MKMGRRLRCSSVTYPSRYAPSSRLAGGNTYLLFIRSVFPAILSNKPCLAETPGVAWRSTSITETLPGRNTAIITADLGNLCSDLEHFKLPSALADLKADTFVFWNASFCEKMGLTGEELAQVKLSGLIRLDEKYAGLTIVKTHPNHPVRSGPCAIRRPATDEVLPARAMKHADRLLLLLLDFTAPDPKFEGYIHGRLVGREEEANRMRKFFHDLLSSKILVASFLAHAAQDNLARRRAEESDDLQKVTTLLDEVIDAIVHGFQRTPSPSEPSPDHEIGERYETVSQSGLKRSPNH
jgi:hypothetical protein